MNQDEYFMSLALKEAKKYLGDVNPNPPVGAVIVKNNKLLAVSAHKKFGEAHAEINAMNLLTEQELKDSTIYVTLEPCSHFGKTPPCMKAIVKNQLKRVVIGCLDVNPLVINKTVNYLRENNIEVTIGVLEEECNELIKHFKHYIINKIPYVTYKYAMTLDGKICTDTYDSKWITNDASRQYCHYIRSQYQAIMVGINTVLKDDPILTSRQDKTPIRIICDTNLKINIDSQIVKTANQYKTIVCCSHWVDSLKEKELTEHKIQILKVDSNSDNQLDLKDLMIKLGALKIDSIYLEGGPTLATSFLKEKLVNNLQVFIGSKLVGSVQNQSPIRNLNLLKMCEAYQLKYIQIKKIQDDILIEGEIKY